MKEVRDRVPLYPGRVTLTPVTGQTNTYDMVRADQPSVSGTPINKELFDSIQLAVDKQLYVSLAGNDTTGDGSQLNPYRTITKALDTLPKDLGGKASSITIEAGAYNESLQVTNFSNGAIQINANNASILGIRVQRAHISYPNISIINTASGNGVSVGTGGYLSCNTFTSTAPLFEGVRVENNGLISIQDIEASNCTNAAVIVSAGGTIICRGAISGSGNRFGIAAYSGGKVTYSSLTISASVVTQTANGGRIYAGAQTSIPNY